MSSYINHSNVICVLDFITLLLHDSSYNNLILFNFIYNSHYFTFHVFNNLLFEFVNIHCHSFVQCFILCIFLFWSFFFSLYLTCTFKYIFIHNLSGKQLFICFSFLVSINNFFVSVYSIINVYWRHFVIISSIVTSSYHHCITRYENIVLFSISLVLQIINSLICCFRISWGFRYFNT